MVGMAGSAYALGGIGGAIGDIAPLLGKSAATGKIAETLADADRLLNETEKASKLSEFAANLRKLDTKNFNILDKGQRLVGSAFASAGISGSMALETMNSTREKLKQDYLKDHGVEAADEELKKIDEFSSSAGNMMFGLSELISAYSFHGTLGKIMGNFGKNEAKTFADNVVLKQGEKELESGLQSEGKAGLKTIGENGEVTQGNVDPTMYAAKADENHWYYDSKLGKITSKIGKVWGIKPALGMAEFNTLTPGVANYYDKKYRQGDADVFSDLIGPGVKDIFTKEGLESMFIGR